MSDVRSFSFVFEGKEYYAILRKRLTKQGFQYHVRIMNHKLDTMLGHECNNFFLTKDDVPFPVATDNKEGRLSNIICDRVKAMS